jgi:amidophosphoribosyltransferase
MSLKEKCGIYGIFMKTDCKKCIPQMIDGLELLQHRGQESCGLCYVEENNLVLNKSLGLVKDVFSYKSYVPSASHAIGHVRYSTSGKSKLSEKDKYVECQPLYGKCKLGEFYVAHNGNIPNTECHDTQHVINCIIKSEKAIWKDILIELIETIPVAYCLLIITSTELFVLRDRYGIRPVCVGKSFDGNDYCVSSESCALKEYDFLREVKAGEIIKIDKNGLNTLYNFPNAQSHICAFEYIYFMRESSICNGYRVKLLREMLGTQLSKIENEKFDKNTVVVGVPISGITAAKSYAKSIGLKYVQLITKNPSVGRTFIAPTDEQRKRLCKEKFLYNKSEIKDKRIIIIDDTIVRGNVIKTIIKYFNLCGAREVHVRVPAPPVIDVCSLGIDIPNREELLAYNKSNDEIRKELGIKSLQYLTVDALDELFDFLSYKECFGERLIYD